MQAIAYENETSTAWAQVDLGEISSIEAFIAKYPDSQYVAEAKQQITDINDNIAWGNASSKEDYQKYLVDYPKGLHKDDAQKYIDIENGELCIVTIDQRNHDTENPPILRTYVDLHRHPPAQGVGPQVNPMDCELSRA